nr:hypothetical protein [Tanacetum cinerariifolium]
MSTSSSSSSCRHHHLHTEPPTSTPSVTITPTTATAIHHHHHNRYGVFGVYNTQRARLVVVICTKAYGAFGSGYNTIRVRLVGCETAERPSGVFGSGFNNDKGCVWIYTLPFDLNNSMDKSWIRTSRTKKEYIDGVEAFIKYAVHKLQKMRNIDTRGNKQQLMMPCPCTTRLNHIEHKVEEVQFHIFKYGIDLSYTKWDKHGEKDEQATTAQIHVGIPPDKHVTNENEDEKPLSADKSSEFSREVERELAISKDSVSETVRWISYRPRATIVKYEAYNINGYTFRTKSNDGIVYQNSRVSVEVVDLHISKEVVTIRKAFYYGVLLEIWVIDYHFRQISLFKCDLVNHKAGGVKHDPNLGYTLVDLNSLGHKDDPFILASQARQVFYVKDQIDKKLSIVFRTLPRITKIHMMKSTRNLVQLYSRAR